MKTKLFSLSIFCTLLFAGAAHAEGRSIVADWTVLDVTASFSSPRLTQLGALGEPSYRKALSDGAETWTTLGWRFSKGNLVCALYIETWTPDHMDLADPNPFAHGATVGHPYAVETNATVDIAVLEFKLPGASRASVQCETSVPTNHYVRLGEIREVLADVFTIDGDDPLVAQTSQEEADARYNKPLDGGSGGGPTSAAPAPAPAKPASRLGRAVHSLTSVF